MKTVEELSWKKQLAMARVTRPPITFHLGPWPILAVALAALYFAREILIPPAFALTLTLVLSAAVSWLGKFHVSRTPAVLIVILMAVGASGNLAWVIGRYVKQTASDVMDLAEQTAGEVRQTAEETIHSAIQNLKGQMEA